MTHSESLDQLATALAKAQAAVKGAKRDSANPYFKSTYADLASVWEACREAFTSNGLSVVQFPGFDGGVAMLTTYLLHSSGQWMCGTAGTPLVKSDPQGVGSAITYLRRYALAAVASVAPEDDDGNDASGRTMQTPAGRRPPAGASASGQGGSLVAPPPLDQPPPALAEKEPMPWEGDITDLTPCPHTSSGKSVSIMTRAELVKLQAWLVQHQDAKDAPTWALLVKTALSKRP